MAVLLAILLGVTFRDGIAEMVWAWGEPEYQHGYLIPLVSLYLIWVKAEEIARLPTQASWFGVALVAVSLSGFLIGELSAVYTIIQYSLIIAIWGLVWTAVGRRGVLIMWAGLVYLLFMIPLPRFFQFNLSNIFQLWSSEIGTAFLRAVGISVFLEGNVIDLGNYRLQVVEACSGLRYLFPLMSFGFFCAYIFRGPVWQKIVIFLSTMPITIFMNSFRIAVTGVLVNRFGTSQAEGFLHYFEGWIIFVACIALLFLEMAVFAIIGKRKLAEVFEVEIPELGDFRYLLGDGKARPQVLAVVGLLAAGVLGSVVIQNREEIIPAREPLASFPLLIDDWSGQDGRLEKDVLDQLKLTDYVVSTFQSPTSELPAELYVAYYESQRKGASVHSPRACLPGGGWQIEDFSQQQIAGVGPGGNGLAVNRAIIRKGEGRALVYYWFMQRGRYLTNEYLVKWYIFWDSLTLNRSDGAMVRVVVPVPEGTEIAVAEKVAERFIGAVEPKLYYHVPQQDLIPHNAGPLASRLAN
jgi:exosortase D (VPLPA-CTERM-specific)